MTDSFSQVVPDESSSLDSRKYGNDTIHAHHMGMCRFEDKNDDGYEKFKGVLANFLKQISEQQNAVKASIESDARKRDGQSLLGTWSELAIARECKDTD